MKFCLLTAMLLAPVVFAPAPANAVPAARGARSADDVANGPTPARDIPDAGTNAPGSAIPPMPRNVPVTRHVLPAPSSRFNEGTDDLGDSTPVDGPAGTPANTTRADMQGSHTNNP